MNQASGNQIFVEGCRSILDQRLTSSNDYKGRSAIACNFIDNPGNLIELDKERVRLLKLVVNYLQYVH